MKTAVIAAYVRPLFMREIWIYISQSYIYKPIETGVEHRCNTSPHDFLFFIIFRDVA